MRTTLMVCVAVVLGVAGCVQYDLSAGSATAVARVVDGDGFLVPSAAITYPMAITFDGSESYTGNGDGQASDFTWTWYNVPEETGWAIGSSDGIDSPNAMQTKVTPNVLGVYMASLEAAGENTGVSTNLAVATAFAINLQGLEVRLTWDKDTTDMDLHLINGNTLQGSYWTANDCYFGNPSPDWGLPGEGLDNPILIDDVDDGYGPESINILEPADGTYAVAVTYHNDWDTGVGAAPQVSVWYDGASLHTWQGPSIDEGDVIFMGTFDWPFTAATEDGGVHDHTALGGDPYNQT